MGFVTTKKPTIMFRVSRTDVPDALKRAAQDDMRSVAVLLEKITIEWLTDRGYLPKSSRTQAQGREVKQPTNKRRGNERGG
jgi:hypothetical protein